MSKLIRSATAALVILSVVFYAHLARPVDAQWSDREVASATLQAKTIPPPATAGAAPYCSWTSLVTTTSLIFTWAPPAGYPATTIQMTAQKESATQPVTGASTTSSGGVYTTTVPVSVLNALGSLLGGTVFIRIATLDPQTGWASKSVDYKWVMSLAGVATSCSATSP